LRELAGWSLDRLKTEVLPEAKAYYKAAARGRHPEHESMDDDELVAVYLADRYRALRDDLFKVSYLPAPEALREQDAAVKRLEAVKSPAMAFFVALHSGSPPATFLRPLASQLGLDRRIATLRVIEAIRLSAAAHDGALPEALDQITEVPVPEDPATGKPFIYRRAGSAALLHGPQAGLRAPFTPYRITVRKAS
jgi:hypothetical protein